MLTLVASILIGQTRPHYTPKAPPRTRMQDRRYGWGNSNRATVTVNGREVSGRAIIRDNRVQVPMRPIFEALGADVMWYPESHKVVALTRNRTISLILNENTAYNPEPVTLDYPPRMVRGTVYVPLRFVSQTLGAKVRFDQRRKIAHVDLPVRGEGR